MRVNCNVSALIANNQLSKSDNSLSQAIERLSSGLRINKASDDASGMAMSKKMHTQLKALDRAKSNTTDGVSVVQTAEASLGEIENILQRMRELAVQSANGTNSDSDREAIQSEISQLQKEVDRISTDTEYNTMPLLDGTLKRRAFVDTDEVEMTNMSSSVPSGEYTFSITQEAKCAEATVDFSGVLGTGGTLWVDGAQIDISKDDDYAAAYDKFVTLANRAGLEIDGDGSGSVTFKEKVSGSFHPIDVQISEDTTGVNVTGDNIVFDSESKTYSVPGQDAEGTLNTGSDFSTTASFRADGNRIVVRDVNDFEMRFDIPNDTTLTAVTFKVTDIGTMNIQAGANEGQQITIDIPEINCHTLEIDYINVGTDRNAGNAIASIDQAIDRVSSVRSKLGAYQNRLETTQTNLATYNENLTRALSGIEDCDMAEEMTEYTSQNVKTQAATSVLAQANQRPQTVLQLLQ